MIAVDIGSPTDRVCNITIQILDIAHGELDCGAFNDIGILFEIDDDIALGCYKREIDILEQTDLAKRR